MESSLVRTVPGRGDRALMDSKLPVRPNSEEHHMSFTRFAQTAVAILVVVALGIVATACGDDDDVDGDGTTPTPGVVEAQGLDGFFAFAPTLDSALRSGNADFVTARVHATDG